MSNSTLVRGGFATGRGVRFALASIYERFFLSGVAGKGCIHINEFGFSEVTADSQLSVAPTAVRLIIQNLIKHGFTFTIAPLNGVNGIFIARTKENLKGGVQ
ncbi:hypothetical protein I5Q45_03790 [Serratia marcescens]|nr:hypothetical protein [Serratia marcescens]